MLDQFLKTGIFMGHCPADEKVGFPSDKNLHMAETKYGDGEGASISTGVLQYGEK